MEQDQQIVDNGMSYESEIDAMRQISNVFTALDSGAQERVIAWLSSRFGISRGKADMLQSSPALTSAPPVADRRESVAPYDATNFDHPAELFEAARPKTDAERALVLAYWFQVCQGAPSFTSRQVNDELKHIGHGVGNITRALDGLIESKPATVIQLEKSGKSKQAQKKFRLTHEGQKRVQQLISRTGEE
ncbi:MAG TPA: hypothetical protein VJ865_16010 [Gemmatimonadaceae bacterium]|nr:hypothetical protein [Gemmatimonadaceae bacterium]